MRVLNILTGILLVLPLYLGGVGSEELSAKFGEVRKLLTQVRQNPTPLKTQLNIQMPSAACADEIDSMLEHVGKLKDGLSAHAQTLKVKIESYEKPLETALEELEELKGHRIELANDQHLEMLVARFEKLADDNALINNCLAHRLLDSIYTAGTFLESPRAACSWLKKAALPSPNDVQDKSLGTAFLIHNIAKRDNQFLEVLTSFEQTTCKFQDIIEKSQSVKEQRVAIAKRILGRAERVGLIVKPAAEDPRNLDDQDEDLIHTAISVSEMLRARTISNDIEPLSQAFTSFPQALKVSLQFLILRSGPQRSLRDALQTINSYVRQENTAYTELLESERKADQSRKKVSETHAPKTSLMIFDLKGVLDYLNEFPEWESKLLEILESGMTEIRHRKQLVRNLLSFADQINPVSDGYLEYPGLKALQDAKARIEKVRKKTHFSYASFSIPLNKDYREWAARGFCEHLANRVNDGSLECD